MHKKKLISFILPVYNEYNGLSIIFNELTNYASNLATRYEYEIIFVDDGSSDNSWELIKNLSQQDSHVKGISFSHNFGYQYALTAGYDYAQGDALITMDSDMQHPPYLIEKMVQKWEQGFPIVYAQRINRDDTFLKKLTAACYYKILQMIATITIPRNVSDFRLIDKKVAVELRKFREKSRYLRGLVAWLGFNHSFVKYEQPARLIGTTKYTWSKLFKIALDGIIGFSKPFSFIAHLAHWLLIATIIFIGLICLSNLVITKPLDVFSYWSMLLYLLLSLQLFFITLLGKKIEKQYEAAQQRPLYSIDNTINC